MDPITHAIISALSTGAAAGVTDASKKAIVEAYGELKSLLIRKFGGHSEVAQALNKLQVTPDSLGRKETLAEEMEAVNAPAEPELLSAAESLLALVQALPGQHVQAAEGTGIAQADRGSTASVAISNLPSGKHDD
jgi:hypothetical protein